MSAESAVPRNETISIEEAKRQVEIAAQRIALLHLSFAKTLVKELGEEKGKMLILQAIKDYGNRCGERVRKGVIAQNLDPIPENYGVGDSRDLPKFGVHERTETVEIEGERRIRAWGCVLAKIWREYGEYQLGRLYCYVDPAKYMAFNPKFKLIHLKALPDGDECCEFAIRPTTEQDRKNFAAKDTNWPDLDK